MKAMAFFDLDGTVLDCTSLLSFHEFMSARVKREASALSFQEVCALAGQLKDQGVPRDEINAWYYRRCFGKLSARLVQDIAHQWYREVIAAGDLLRAAALNEIAMHMRARRPCVFLTGSCREVVVPIAQALGFSDILCAPLVVDDGFYTGEMNGPPCIGEGKVVHLTEYARRHEVDLSCSFGYGDDISDAHFLHKVGHPNVIRGGDKSLLEVARVAGWNVL